MANTPNDTSVETILNGLDEAMKKDATQLISMLRRISGHEPAIWNIATIGFDSYHYKYESGREGDCHILGFYPRKDKMTIYLMDGTSPYVELLKKLGKHSTSKACIYIKRLSDVDTNVLEEIVQKSYDYVKSQDGETHRMVS